MDFLGARRRHCCDVTGASGIIDRRRRRHSLPAEASPPFSLLGLVNVDLPHIRSQYTKGLFWAAILIPLPSKYFPETSRRKYHVQIMSSYRRYCASQNDRFTYIYHTFGFYNTSKRIANRVLLEVVHKMEQGILYFLNAIRI